MNSSADNPSIQDIANMENRLVSDLKKLYEIHPESPLDFLVDNDDGQNNQQLFETKLSQLEEWRKQCLHISAYYAKQESTTQDKAKFANFCVDLAPVINTILHNIKTDSKNKWEMFNSSTMRILTTRQHASRFRAITSKLLHWSSVESE